MTDPRDALGRRALLGGAAALSATLVGACQGETPPAADAGADAGNPTAADVTLLNGLLSSEYRAIAAYSAGAAILTSPAMDDPQRAVAPVLLAIAMRWQAQHRDHAAALVDAIRMAGGAPVEESAVGMFTPPMGFRPTAANVLRLAANAEKAAAIDYNRAVRALGTTDRRFLAGVIGGDETQHFVVLYTLITQVVGAGPAIATGIDDVVPASFVSTLGSARQGLQSVPDLRYG